MLIHSRPALRWSRDFQLIMSTKKDGGLKPTLAMDAFNVLNEVNHSYFVGNRNSAFFDGDFGAATSPNAVVIATQILSTNDRVRGIRLCLVG